MRLTIRNGKSNSINVGSLQVSTGVIRTVRSVFATPVDCFPVIADLSIEHMFCHMVSSAAEDKVVFPAVNRKVKQRVSYTTDHADEERKFDDVRRLLEGVQAAVNSNSTAAELYGELCVQAEVIVETIQQHLLDEEDQVS